MLFQERLIARVREVCRADERLDGALMYGSFASGEADAYSDVEFWLFFKQQRSAEADPWTWCAQIAPVTHLVRNEFGTDVVFFPGLVRGEFHFATTDGIPLVRSWPARSAPPDRMIVLDRSGTLRPALESLPVHRHLLWMAIRAAWILGRRYWTELAELHDRPVPLGLFAELDSAL